MQSGLKNLQAAARACARHERPKGSSLAHSHSGSSSGLGLSVHDTHSTYTDDSGVALDEGIENLEAEYPKDFVEQYGRDYELPRSTNKRVARLPTINMGVRAIINRSTKRGSVDMASSHEASTSEGQQWHRTPPNISVHKEIYGNPVEQPKNQTTYSASSPRSPKVPADSLSPAKAETGPPRDACPSFNIAARSPNLPQEGREGSRVVQDSGDHARKEGENPKTPCSNASISQQPSNQAEAAL